MTFEQGDSEIFYGRFKNNFKNGYGILKCQNGEVFRGEFRQDQYSGYGNLQRNNKNEYDGQWTYNYKHGVVIFKEAETGRIEKRQYENDNFRKILEIIAEGK